MAASVQSMLDYWKKFNLSDLQKELDTTATELASRQDSSDASRKKLVEQSREFKKSTPEDIRKVVSPLLKSFQGEIDALSKRSKSAEAAFLSIYKRLIDLPDPVTVLEYAQQIQKKAQKVSDLEIENKQLRETLDEYNHEFAEVKNQEVTIKQLRERLKEGEDKIGAVAETRAREKERELQKLFADKEHQLQETQLAVARKLGEAEQKVTTLKNTLENVQSELFEVKAKYDEATSAKSDEMEMVMADLDRANERATAAEREAEKLKHQLNTLTVSLTEGNQSQKGPDMEQAIEILQQSNLKAELAAKEKEISQLVDDVQRLQASLQKLRENTSLQVGRLEEELASKTKAFGMLEERLKAQEDYEEIKKELSVLKSIEFSSSNPTDEVDGDIKSKPLEVLLLEKNKALQNEVTQVKVTCNDVSGNSSPALSSNAEAFASLLGEEIAASYQGKTSPEEPPAPAKNGISSPAFNAVSPKKEPLEKTLSPESGDIPPQVPSSPHSDISSRHTRPPSVNDVIRMPPQSPQFFHPSFNSHLMANFMGMGLNLNNAKADMSNCQGLDTGMVAKTVRELLSIHNIGQRLFAKHVLGLSQGTVSELLSKPKSWDKLTEKGRESYRKMHSWATDERNIMALKAISPKKGSQPLLPSIQREDSVTEERITHILNEAQQQMQSKKSQEQQWSKEHQNAMVTSIYQEMARYGMHNHPLTVTSPTSMVQYPNPNLEREHRKPSGDHHKHKDKSYEPDVSSKEMVERIYRQELIKLAQAAENAGNIAASALYQQELARLARNARLREEPEPGEVRHLHGSPERKPNVKLEPPDSTSEDLLNQSNGPIDLSKHSTSSPTTPTSGGSEKSLNSSAQNAGSAFFHVRPKVNGHDERLDAQQTLSPAPHTAFTQQTPGESASPLQRMQNIANSLMTRPQIGATCSKPLRAVLPPITQEEFDSYANINTEDLVKQVKETLSQYSISQRLFGESILGLSQGSVSDLLARPKPWHMLTQKGREPFIRMQLFLEDAEAIPKLVASQYHIAPDKLMRSNSMGKEQMEVDYQGAWQGTRSSLPAALPLVNAVAIAMTANRRRRHSLEDRYDSPMALPKRPRVFFTEEQKERLRQAYNRDPYPNQSTIEALANTLNVGVKTVINWFHNHRMRAKQQQHATSPTTPNSEYSQSGMPKDESNDDNSNNSDISSMSGDNRESGNMHSFPSRFPNTESGQWMFPQFEPVNLDGKKDGRSSSYDIQKGGSDGEGDDADDNERYSSSPNSVKDIASDAKESDKEEEMVLEKDENSNMEVLMDKGDKDLDLSKGSQQNVTHSGGANKRKRSNPQYVSAGRHLDKTCNRLEKLTKTDNSLQDDCAEDEKETEKENTDENVEGGKRVKTDAEEDGIRKKVSEKSEDRSQSSSLEKIQKNITQHSSDDWEF